MKHNICVECGTPILKKAIRCRPCNFKYRKNHGIGMVLYKCPQCNLNFERKWRGENRHPKFCSYECKHNSYKQRRIEVGRKKLSKSKREKISEAMKKAHARNPKWRKKSRSRDAKLEELFDKADKNKPKRAYSRRFAPINPVLLQAINFNLDKIEELGHQAMTRSEYLFQRNELIINIINAVKQGE